MTSPAAILILMVLDLRLRDNDAFDLARRVRLFSTVFVIAIDARLLRRYGTASGHGSENGTVSSTPRQGTYEFARWRLDLTYPAAQRFKRRTHTVDSCGGCGSSGFSCHARPHADTRLAAAGDTLAR